MNFKQICRAAPFMLTALFGTAAETAPAPKTTTPPPQQTAYDKIYDSYRSDMPPSAQVRFYRDADHYLIADAFKINDSEAHIIIPQDTSAGYAIERYVIDGDDYYQLRNGGYGPLIGAINLNAAHICLSPTDMINLSVAIRPSMSDLAANDENLDDIEMTVSAIFNRHAKRRISGYDNGMDINDDLIIPVLSATAAEVEARFGLSLLITPDQIVRQVTQYTSSDNGAPLPQCRRHRPWL